MKTKYVSIEVKLNEKDSLYVDGNSKITAGNGTFEDPKPNAFSLPHVSTCPGATSNCLKSCYVYGLKQNASEVYENYCKNERVVNKLLSDDNLWYSSAKSFGKWISENCKGGFRWHVSGDVFSKEYARWIVYVCKNSSNINHWIYTRSLFAVEILNHADNLEVNISCDSENYDLAHIKHLMYGNRLCYFENKENSSRKFLPKNSVIFPDYHLRGRDLDYPKSHSWWKSLDKDEKKMVYMADFVGQSEKVRCGICTKCIKKANNLRQVKSASPYDLNAISLERKKTSSNSNTKKLSPYLVDSSIKR